MEDFNKERFYLGTLCFKNHNFDNTGKSLRYIKSNHCIECNKINNSSEYRKNYDGIHIEDYKKYRKIYNQREEVIKIRKEKHKIKYKNNLSYKLGHCISTHIYNSLKGSKNWGHWEELVGYKIDDLKKHIESLWEEGMSWSNYGRGKGKWNIDHVTPITYFNIIDYECEDFKKAFLLSNLQPMWSHENQSKGNYYEGKYKQK